MPSSFDSYQIRYKTTSDSTYTYYDTSSSLTPIIKPLSPNTSYYIQLIPYSNTSGLYGSAINTFTTTLAKLTSFAIGQVNTNDISLNWTGIYNYVKIYYGIASGTYTNNVNSYDTSKNITGLTPNTTYYFNITPYNGADISAGYYSEKSSITLAKLTDFSFGQVNDTDIKLKWTGNYNYVKVYYGNTISTYTNIVTSYDNNTTITGLTAGTIYYFNIVPYNSLDISTSYYGEISTKTPVIVYNITYDSNGTYTKSNGSLYYFKSGSNSTLTVNKDCKVKILLVGGGGGGGRDAGGGGGGGGVIYLDASYLYASTTYHLTIGSGGAGGSSSDISSGSNGGNTFITELNLTAVGGGGGGAKQVNGLNGGSGGGAGHTATGSFSGGSGTSGQGYSGGSSGSASAKYGGGGGGAGGAGTNITADTPVGNGGIGFQNSITGTNTYYGGGGGGGNWQQTSNGRSTGGGGGGGAGGYGDVILPMDGSANTGGGGGGGGALQIGSGRGGAGGSGVIIVYIDYYYTELKSFTFGQVNTNDISLNWTGIYSYVKIYYGTTSNTYTNSVTSYDTNTTITGLAQNTRYYFNIVPYNSLDLSSGYYGEISTITLPKITSQYVYGITYSTITLGLSGSYDRNVIYYSVDSGSTYTYYDTSATSLITVNGLTANQRYYFKITPLNIVNVSGTTVYITDASAVTSAYINSFNKSQTTQSSITLTWTGIYSNAVIYYGLTSGSTTNNVPINPASTDIGISNTTTISTLNAGTPYYFSIYPYNSISNLGTISNTNASTDQNVALALDTDSNLIIWIKAKTGDLNSSTGVITNYGINTSIITGSIATSDVCGSTISTTTYKFGTSSLYNYNATINKGSGIACTLSLPSKNWCFSFWWNPDRYIGVYGNKLYQVLMGIGLPSDIAHHNLDYGVWNYGDPTPKNNPSIFYWIGGSQSNSPELSYNFVLNTWYHVVINTDASVCSWYVNNVFCISGNNPIYPIIPNNTSKVLQLTGQAYTNNQYVPGYFSDIRYYGRTLTKTDISNLYYYTNSSY